MGTHPIFESDFDCLTVELFLCLTKLTSQSSLLRLSSEEKMSMLRFSTKLLRKKFQLKFYLRMMLVSLSEISMLRLLFTFWSFQKLEFQCPRKRLTMTHRF